MSSVSHEDDSPGLTILSPDEALRRAKQGTLPLLPPLEEMGIEGLTDEEWDAFQDALRDT